MPEGIVIPAKSSVVLQPSGYHLMFMDFTELLKQGDSFPAKLNFEHEGSVAVTFQVLGYGRQGRNGGLALYRLKRRIARMGPWGSH